MYLYYSIANIRTVLSCKKIDDDLKFYCKMTDNTVCWISTKEFTSVYHKESSYYLNKYIKIQNERSIKRKKRTQRRPRVQSGIGVINVVHFKPIAIEGCKYSSTSDIKYNVVIENIGDATATVELPESKIKLLSDRGCLSKKKKIH